MEHQSVWYKLRALFFNFFFSSQFEGRGTRRKGQDWKLSFFQEVTYMLRCKKFAYIGAKSVPQVKLIKLKISLFWFWWYKKKNGSCTIVATTKKRREEDEVEIFRRASLRDLAPYYWKFSPFNKATLPIRKSLIACFSFLGEPLAMTTFLTIPTIASRYSIHMMTE